MRIKLYFVNVKIILKSLIYSYCNDFVLKNLTQSHYDATL